MNRTRLKIAAASVLPAVATLLFVQACGGGSDAVAQSSPDPIIGVWDAVATVRDCTTNAAGASFRGSQALHLGGTLSDTNAGPPTARGPGFGLWSRNANGTYAVKFRFYRYNPDGTLAGHNVITSTRTLTADNNGYSGVTQNEVRDVSGNLLATVCVTDVATRFS